MARKEERELLDGFADRATRAEEIVGLLCRLFKENSLPEDVNDPKDPLASTAYKGKRIDLDFSISILANDVNWFANKLEDYALELSELAEDMKVGALMQKVWDEKEENTISYSEKLAEYGHKESDF